MIQVLANIRSWINSRLASAKISELEQQIAQINSLYSKFRMPPSYAQTDDLILSGIQFSQARNQLKTAKEKFVNRDFYGAITSAQAGSKLAKQVIDFLTTYLVYKKLTIKQIS